MGVEVEVEEAWMKGKGGAQRSRGDGEQEGADSQERRSADSQAGIRLAG